MPRKRILLFEDRELFAALEEAFFVGKGVELLVARSGQEAFRIIEEQDPDLVFLDLEMPGISGAECCRMVKKDPFLSSTPVILVTSSMPEGGTPACEGIGCDAILPRPIDRRQVLSLSCRFLNIGREPDARLATDLSVRYWLKPGKGHKGRTLDLAVGGAFIATDHLLPVDKVVPLDIFLPGREKPLHCRARVAWVNHPEWVKKADYPSGMGVQFVDLGPEERSALELFLCRPGPEETESS